MSATERVHSERDAAKKEGSQRAGEHNKCVIMQAREQTTVGSDSFEAQSSPLNHKVLKHMMIHDGSNRESAPRERVQPQKRELREPVNKCVIL